MINYIGVATYYEEGEERVTATVFSSSCSDKSIGDFKHLLEENNSHQRRYYRFFVVEITNETKG